MYCSQCGRELLAEARFCGACGAPVSGGPSPQGGWQPAAAVAATGAGHASFWLRFAGWIIDVIVTSVGGAMLGAVVGIVYLVATAGEGDGTVGLGNGTQLLGAVFGFGYKWLLDSNGGTIGKMAVGIRVVDDVTLQPIGYSRGLGRTLMSIVSSIPFALGFLWAAWDRRGKTWHDHVAGSIVVSRTSAGS